MAVQRHTAASRSRRPWSTEQQGVSGGFPTTAPTTWPLSNLAQTPSFIASLGQLFVDVVGFGIGFRFGFGWKQVLQPLTCMKSRMLTDRKRAIGKDRMESISLTSVKSTD